MNPKYDRRPPEKRKENDLVNEKIPAGDLRLVNEKGENMGMISKEKAISYAQNLGLDVVVVSKNKPYTAKVLDYSKYLFDQRKKQKELKKKQQIILVKEIRISPVIQENDLQTKLNHAKRFIEKGNKVKISMLLKGRMRGNSELGLKVINDFINKMENITVESKPKQEGFFINAILSPNSKKK